MSALKKTWIPDRKFLAAGVAGVVTWLLILIAAAAGVELPAETAAALSGGVMALVFYAVPPSVADVVRRVDDTLKQQFAEEIAGKLPLDPETAARGGGSATKLLAAFLLVGGLAFAGPSACGTISLVQADKAQASHQITAEQTVYALQADYNAALLAAVTYVESDLAVPDVTANIIRLERLAWSALARAQYEARHGGSATKGAAIALARAAIDELSAYLQRTKLTALGGPT
ncbi:hypothetical protein [Oceanibaculum indicum]|uniref:Uncharacterized protein n=1 Tax=Oceanibaculum indicum P24 TaxID=1207063 RepID=K2J5T9_9PROT|nr:hypothetical protein [Oceanibaculum indicum]EKE78446.1 hypothetical protein P24_02761 [Oceanibaculum indicum P24]